MRSHPEHEIVIEAKGLGAGYAPGHLVLEGVELALRRGERLFVCGANGSGKSCLLRTLAGRIPARVGHIERHAAARFCGYVPQSFELEPGLPITVREFVSLGTVGLGLGRGERQERLVSALESMGLSTLARRSFAQLSGGERQRTLVARALTRGAELLFLDEPTASLDPRGEHELHHWLDRLVRKHRMTLVCVSHALGIARAHADRVAVVANGSVQLGDVEEAFASSAMQQALGFDCASLAVPAEQA